jgi:uncharacterized protein
MTNKKTTNKKIIMANKKTTKSKNKRSLTEQFEGKKNSIMSAPPLRDVAETVDIQKVMQKNFPRTIKDVKVVKNGRVQKSDILSQIMDSDIVPNEGQSISLFNHLDARCVDEKVWRYFADKNAWLGWMSCATLAQHPMISRACSIPGEDAISVGYKICVEDGDANGDGIVDPKDEKYLHHLVKQAKRMGLEEVCRRFDANKRVFGIGICVPCFEAQSESGRRYIWNMLANPMNLDALNNKEVVYTGMKVVDPYWLTPVFDDESGFNPISKDFYMPTWWQVGTTTKRIHKSWCVQCVNTIIADILKPTYFYGGLPLPQMLMNRMYSADKVADEAQMLAMSKRLLVVDANVNKLVANPKEAAKVMDALKFARDNWGVFFKNPNTQVQQVDTYITEFNQLIMTQYQLVASIAQMPAPKLLKVMPTGFSDVSELVWKDYAQALTNIQENEYVPILERHFKFISKSLKKKDVNYEVIFNPIDVPTLMEKAQITGEEAKADKMLIESGVLAPEEVRTKLRAERGGRYNHIERTAPEDAKRTEEIMSDNQIKNATKNKRSLEKKLKNPLDKTT